MLRGTLNLGILAHVDAGKTTLTERLLHAAGVIDELGSVDAGTTQTDSLALEQQRGITIRSAVASFAVGDVLVNLIDTPGHPDFIAEVERVLNVLDGVVLVVSAVEGVQPQTRILMRAAERLRLPTLLFVNKIDRPGADPDRVFAQIGLRLTPSVVALGRVVAAGTRGATFVPGLDASLVETLAEHDERLLASYVDGRTPVPTRLRAALATQSRRALVHPVLFGSALTGAGVDELIRSVVELLPTAPADADGPLSATVFKVERGAAGEKVAYVRLFGGTLRVRQRVSFGRGDDGAKVTALAVFGSGLATRADDVTGGRIAKVWGLGGVQIGDTIGIPGPRTPVRVFVPPTFESAIAARDAADGAALYAALTQLAEQDPLIDVRRDEAGRISTSLYGEVQKEVIEATLASDYGLEVTFHETRPIHVERPLGRGEAVELLHAESNPFFATIAFRVEPGAAGSGLDFRLEVDARAAPLYLFKTLEGLGAHMREHVCRTLDEGLFGWRVTDCVVTLTRCEYSSADGPPSRRGPTSTAADFRKLTPLVLMRALRAAGTVVCEPILRSGLEVPVASIGAVLAAVARLGGTLETQTVRGGVALLEAILPAARVHELQRRLPSLTGGEAVFEESFAGYRPVAGEQPTRPRTTPDPLNLPAYMRQFTGIER